MKGEKWHTLIDKVQSDLSLYTSARRVLSKKGAPGVDGKTTRDYAEHEMATFPETVIHAGDYHAEC